MLNLIFLWDLVLSLAISLICSHSVGSIRTKQAHCSELDYVWCGKSRLVCNVVLWKTCAPLIKIVLRLNISEHFSILCFIMSHDYSLSSLRWVDDETPSTLSKSPEHTLWGSEQTPQLSCFSVNNMQIYPVKVLCRDFICRGCQGSDITSLQ